MAVDIIARGLAAKTDKYIFAQNYDELLTYTPIVGALYYCIESQGTWWLPGTLGGTYFPSGRYYHNGITWVFAESSDPASQDEVDAGVNDLKFLTPKTFNSSVQLYDKAAKLHSHLISDVVGLADSLNAKAPKNNWLFLASSFSSTPTKIATISTGDVYEYKYNNNTITYYRLVPNGANIDSFYQDFNGTNLNNLIVTKQG